MNIQTESNNKRLLETLDHVDIKYVAELVDGLRLPKPEDGRKGIRTFRHAKQLALIAACALILGTAIPTVQYVLPMLHMVFDGNAGAGTEELEVPTQSETQALETEEEFLYGNYLNPIKGLEPLPKELFSDSFLYYLNIGNSDSDRYLGCFNGYYVIFNVVTSGSNTDG